MTPSLMSGHGEAAKVCQEIGSEKKVWTRVMWPIYSQSKYLLSLNHVPGTMLGVINSVVPVLRELVV